MRFVCFPAVRLRAGEVGLTRYSPPPELFRPSGTQRELQRRSYTLTQQSRVTPAYGPSDELIGIIGLQRARLPWARTGAFAQCMDRLPFASEGC